MKITSTARQLRGDDREELILSLHALVRSTTARLRRLHDGISSDPRADIDGIRTELKRAYDLTEKLGE